MDRLIYKESNGDLTCRSRDFDKVFPTLYAYEETGLTPDEIEQQFMNFSSFLCEMTHGHMSKTNYTVEAMVSEANDCFERVCDECSDREELADFKKLGSIDHIRTMIRAENDGRMVVLPCKKGDTLFVLTWDSLSGIEETKCRNISIINREYGPCAKITAKCVYDDWGGAVREFFPEDFGKTVFLTREEAEDALAKDNNVPARDEVSE